MTSLLLLLAAAAAPAFAAERPTTRLRPEAPAFIAVEDAAVAGLREAMPLSRSYEYGGAVLSSEGRYYFTEPVTNRRTANIDFSVAVPRGYRLAAIYHTHPDEGDQTDLFSPNDVRQAKALEVVSYIGVMRDRTVRVFDPLNMNTRRHQVSGSLVSRGEVAEGRVVAYDLPVSLAASEPLECSSASC
ncbi:MAG: DUF4329 domain-containing protein [Elusimicrobiota bacterium]|nr:DUF4329 domain-containing protein [Elusimicrobiota bacterium]